jgi:hypothetical protein
MRRYIERSSDAGPSSLRLFCLGCIIATRGYDFREGQGYVMSAKPRERHRDYRGTLRSNRPVVTNVPKISVKIDSG